MSEQEASESTQTDGSQLAAILPESNESENNSSEKPESGQSINNKFTGREPIDFATASTEEIQARHDYLYRQIKDQKRTDATLREYKQIAQEQANRIDELTNGFSGVVNHLQEKNFTDNETQLNDALQKAWDAGDHKAYIAAQTKLVLLQSQKESAAKQVKIAPEKPAKQEQRQVENQGGGLEPEDQQVVDVWQDERDEGGQLLRPWAHNRGTPENPDQQFLAGLAETRAVLMSPRFANLSMDQKMAEVDRRMGVQKQGSKQNVMGGGLTGNRKTSKLTLSPKQQEIAVKTKFGGPKAKSDAEHIEAFRKQIEVSKSKGARQ